MQDICVRYVEKGFDLSIQCRHCTCKVCAECFHESDLVSVFFVQTEDLVIACNKSLKFLYIYILGGFVVNTIFKKKTVNPLFIICHVYVLNEKCLEPVFFYF